MSVEAEILAPRLTRIMTALDAIEPVCLESEASRDTFLELKQELDAGRDTFLKLKELESPSGRFDR
jgi:hypothetical protein